LISIDLGSAGWIRSRSGSKTAYQLATIRPDILFAGLEAAGWAVLVTAASLPLQG